jgi:hypothetical protein
VREADDRVTGLDSTGKHRGNDQIFRKLSFPNPIPFFELVVLAKTVHNMKPNYLLFSDNCYFYAGTIVKLLEEIYQPHVDVSTTGSGETVRGIGKKKPGKWNGIKIYADERLDDGSIATMVQSFTNEKNSFLEPVWVFLYHNNLTYYWVS